jgi:hypothetical protein
VQTVKAAANAVPNANSLRHGMIFSVGATVLSLLTLPFQRGTVLGKDCTRQPAAPRYAMRIIRVVLAVAIVGCGSSRDAAFTIVE